MVNNLIKKFPIMAGNDEASSFLTEIVSNLFTTNLIKVICWFIKKKIIVIAGKEGS